MSGSSDRPSLPRRPRQQPATLDDPRSLYADVIPDTGVPTGVSRRGGQPSLGRERGGGGSSGGGTSREFVHHGRDTVVERDPARTPIVPAVSVTGRSLTLVISIMCFLACLTAGAVYMMNQSASAWLQDIASEVTIQIEAGDRGSVEKTMQEVVAFVEQQPGVASATGISFADSASMLEPWLGKTDALDTLPMPRLIAIQLDRNTPPDFERLQTALAERFTGVSLDDHGRWQAQIRSVTRSFALGGIAILILVGAATTAIIVSATRSALASNREIVEVLHLVGATDRFIARQFERHFLRLGIRAGLVGALSAMAVFLAMPLIMQLLGGSQMSAAELQRLIGSGRLDLYGYLWLGAVVVVVAALCMLTSRFGVFRILHSQQ